MSMTTGAPSKEPSPQRALVIAAWLAVGLPLAWGVAQTIQKALPLFSRS